MLVYRITHKSFSKELSATGTPGRWNSFGKKVIYCAESIALAFLENMIRRQGVGFNEDFKIMIIEIPDELKIATVNAGDIKDEWRDFKDYSICQHLGDKWYDEGAVPVFKVPSAVLTSSFNYLINTMHPEFKKIILIETTDLVPTERIEEILKRYTKK